MSHKYLYVLLSLFPHETKMDITILPLKTFKEWWPQDKPPRAFFLEDGIMYIINFSEDSTMKHLVHEIISYVLMKIMKLDIADYDKLHKKFDSICRALPEDFFL